MQELLSADKRRLSTLSLARAAYCSIGVQIAGNGGLAAANSRLRAAQRRFWLLRARASEHESQEILNWGVQVGDYCDERARSLVEIVDNKCDEDPIKLALRIIDRASPERTLACAHAHARAPPHRGPPLARSLVRAFAWPIEREAASLKRKQLLRKRRPLALIDMLAAFSKVRARARARAQIALHLRRRG